MKFALMSYTFARQEWKKDGQFDLAGMCQVGRELGIDGVDMVTTHGLPPQEVRKIVADHGQQVICYTFFPSFNSTAPVERAKVADQVKEGIDIAHTLGTKMLMLFTQGNHELSREASMSNLVQGLQKSVELAGQAGMTATIESVWGSPLAVSKEMLMAIREVPGLQLVYDVGAVYVNGEDPRAFYEACQQHVAHVHFKDGRWKTDPARPVDKQKYFENELIGEGAVDHGACLRAMKAAGYGGYIDIEYEGNKYDPAEGTRRAVGYLRGLMGKM